MHKLFKIFFVMLRIGAFTFGGGLMMAAQMRRDFVERYGWVTDEEVLDIFAVAQTLPGVIAINTSVLIGYKLAKVKGALAAALGAILPSFVVLAVVSLVYDVYIENVYVAGAMRGIRACVIALLFFAGLKMRKDALKNGVFSYIVAALALAVCVFTQINIIFVLLSGAALGIIRWFFVKHNRKESV